MREKLTPQVIFVIVIILVGIISGIYWGVNKYFFQTDIVHPSPSGNAVAQATVTESPLDKVSLFSMNSIDTKTSFEISKEVMDLEEQIDDIDKKIAHLESKKKNIENKTESLKEELHEEVTKNIFNVAPWYNPFKLFSAWKTRDDAVAFIEEDLIAQKEDIEKAEKNIKELSVKKETLETQRENMKTSLKQLNGSLYEDVAYSLAEENIVNIKSNLIDGFFENEQERQQQYQNEKMNGLPPFIMPAHGAITSAFGYRTHPITGARKFHSGVDIGVDYGDPIRASNYGLVIHAGWYSGFGKTVILSHGDGLYTLYAHNSEIKVSEGDKVEQGQLIALGGSSGFSTGPHCHFSMWVNGELVNPLDYMSDYSK